MYVILYQLNNCKLLGSILLYIHHIVIPKPMSSSGWMTTWEITWSVLATKLLRDSYGRIHTSQYRKARYCNRLKQIRNSVHVHYPIRLIFVIVLCIEYYRKMRYNHVTGCCKFCFQLTINKKCSFVNGYCDNIKLTVL